MADALGSLLALHGQAAAAGLVAVDPAGCSRRFDVEGEGRRQGQVSGEEERTASRVERQGGSATRECPFVWGGGGMKRKDRVRQRDGSKPKHGGKWES